LQVMAGQPVEAMQNLPLFQTDYPNHPSVLYLSALLEPDGTKARDQFMMVYKNHPNSEYSDDAVMKIAEYYYAAGLYIQSAEWLKRMALYYSRSEHMDRAVKLFLNSLIVSGSKDTAIYYSKVFKRQFPSMDVDSKISQLLAEEAAKAKAEQNNDLTDMSDNQAVEEVNANELAVVKDTVAESKGQFSIQIGAYGKELNADYQKSQLKAAGMDARVELKESNGRILYAVRIGYYPSRSAAKEAGIDLKRTLGMDSIVTENK